MKAGKGHSIQIVRNSIGNIEKQQVWQRKDRLGKGAFGEVWKEVWEDQNRDWHYRAVKICSEADTETARKYHQRELSALAAFSRSEVSQDCNLQASYDCFGQSLNYIACRPVREDARLVEDSSRTLCCNGVPWKRRSI